MDFGTFVEPMIDLPIAHAWRGHYGTIFLELGQLQAGRKRRDGSIGNSKGAFTIHLEPNWRLEGKRSILCGSADSPRAIDSALQGLIGLTLLAISSYGDLPELEIAAGSLRLRTLSSRKGQPNWTLNRWRRPLAMYCRLGKIAFDGDCT